MAGAVFLDKDGTIHIDKGYTHKPEDFEFVPGALEGLSRLERFMGPKILITNQSGIGRGLYTEEQFHEFMNYVLLKLKQNGIIGVSDKYYFCPHLPDDDCDCRKPKPSMYKQACRDFDLNINECWCAGDSYRDLEPVLKMGGRGVLVKKDGKVFDKNAESKSGFERADNLYDAAEIILKASHQ